MIILTIMTIIIIMNYRLVACRLVDLQQEILLGCALK